MEMEKYKATIQSLKKCDYDGFPNKSECGLGLCCRSRLHSEGRTRVSDP